jgi:hypothetical protein
VRISRRGRQFPLRGIAGSLETGCEHGRGTGKNVGTWDSGDDRHAMGFHTTASHCFITDDPCPLVITAQALFIPAYHFGLNR